LRRPTFKMLKAILWPLPISPRTFSTGTLQSSKMSGVVELPRMPSAPLGEPGRAPLDDHRGELGAVDLEEDDVDVGEAAVGDPHLAAVHDVVLAVRGEPGDGLRAQRVGSAARLGQGVSGHLAAAGQVREVLRLLLRGAEEHDRQRPDPGVGAEGRRPRAVGALRLRHQHRGGLVEPEPAQRLGHVHA